eukprot:m.67928 g.67928  ORF g.67928 m.67928 type:complete len:59 (-) comp12180_c0_seq3:35-211(-)
MHACTAELFMQSYELELRLVPVAPTLFLSFFLSLFYFIVYFVCLSRRAQLGSVAFVTH